MVYSNSFSEYKKTLEDLLQNISFLYSGDVISSEDRTMTMNIKHNSFSPELMKNVLLNIYNDSLAKVIKESKKISISVNNVKDVYQLMDMNTNSKYLFYSSNSNLKLNISSHLEGELGSYFLPSYFNQRIKLASYSSDISAYFSPVINDSVDEYEILFVDKPIQSLVWTLQNMTYEILPDSGTYKHTVNYKFYHCDYNSTVVHVKNTSKLRDEKIDSLLNDN